MNIYKNKKLICLDSDGTIMDTMTTKHKFCFAQVFIEVYGVNKEEDINKIINRWEKVNLFSQNRGMNRFLGLDDIIDFSRDLGYEFDPNGALKKWIKDSKSYSMSSLEEMMKKDPEERAYILAHEWSKKVNEKIKTMPCKAFKNMKYYIEKLSEKCDLVGVSSAPLSAVTEEWTQEGIISFFNDIACQERGTKTDVIASLINKGYDPQNIIVIGDAPGDYKAAENNRTKFYPIMPGEEEKSWEKFFKEAFNRFLENKYDEKFENDLLVRFFEILK